MPRQHERPVRHAHRQFGQRRHVAAERVVLGLVLGHRHVGRDLRQHVVGGEEQVVGGRVQQHLRGRVPGIGHHLGLERPEPQAVPRPQRGVAPRQGRHDRAVAVEPLAHAVELLGREPVGGGRSRARRRGSSGVASRLHAGRQILGLAHGERGAGSLAEPGGGAHVVGVVMGDDQALDRLVRQEAAEHALPQRPRLGRVDAGVDHRPAALAFDEVDVDVVQAERQRQAQPVQAGGDLQRRAVRGRLRERVVERDHGVSSSVCPCMAGPARRRQGGDARPGVAPPRFRAHDAREIAARARTRPPMNLHLPWSKPSPDPVDLNDYARRILTSRVYDVAIQTPLDPLPALSKRLGLRVLLKREDLQPGLLLQDPRRLQQDGGAFQGDSRAGRHHGLGGQPRPGRRLRGGRGSASSPPS